MIFSFLFISFPTSQKRKERHREDKNLSKVTQLKWQGQDSSSGHLPPQLGSLKSSVLMICRSAGGKVWEVKIKRILFVFENSTPLSKIVALFSDPQEASP